MNRRQRRRTARLKRALLLTPGGVLAGAYLVGLALPTVHAVRTELVVPTTAGQLWAVLTDLDAMPTWRRDLVALERLPASAGVVRWREVSREGRRAAFERVEETAGARIVVRLADRRDGRRWVYEVSPAGAGARLGLTEERTLENPLLRTAVRLFGGDRRRLEDWSKDLEVRLAARRQLIAGLDGRRRQSAPGNGTE